MKKILKRGCIMAVVSAFVLMSCKKNTATQQNDRTQQTENIADLKKVSLIEELKLEGTEFKIPKTDSIKIVLSSINPSDSVSSFSYYYDMERGKMFLNHKKIFPLEKGYFVIPFRITNQAKLLDYLALFKTDDKDGRPIHLDSYFIGNQVETLDLASMNNQLVINYTIPENQQTPDTQNTLILIIENELFKPKTP
ncbi:MAG: hypothetical protein ACK5MD_03885 [Flavobacteriales bacterium]